MEIQLIAQSICRTDLLWIHFRKATGQAAMLDLPGTAIHGKIGVMEEVLCGMYFIGIDLGTTGVKAVVFTEDGRIAAMAYEAYRQEAVKGKRELRAEALWESCDRVLAAAMGKCPVQGEGALCVSSLG